MRLSLCLLPLLAAAQDYRITITQNRANSRDKGVQLSEVRLFGAGGQLVVADITNPAGWAGSRGSNQNPAQLPASLIDGDTSTKWFDGALEDNGQSVLELTLADSSKDIIDMGHILHHHLRRIRARNPHHICRWVFPERHVQA